ncbi:hypothetical protein BCR34DRAFT_616154 [Clohesyomyces aquaticus]|uniref:Hydrophobic surface binding protein A-domain-containing protein n=1 Tax=Clohesyomyces aquaticus TaxID=1231657 RepID=A0A1Y1ZFH0_9PLEO|nr:hypothetical protein BCR34DRAFT_616154 [Clohesyomyces aquaticus]
MRPQTIIAYALPVGLALAMPAINPATVTEYTPEQSSSIVDAIGSMLASATSDPNFMSVVMQLATATAALEALSSLENAPLPTGTAALEQLNSIIDQFPSDAQSYFRSVTSAEGAIISSVLNADTTGGASASSPASTGGASQNSAANTKSVASTGVQSTSAGAEESSTAKPTAHVTTGPASGVPTTGGAGAKSTSVATGGMPAFAKVENSGMAIGAFLGALFLL